MNFSIPKCLGYLKAVAPVLLSLGATWASFWLFGLLVKLLPTTGYPGIPLILGIALIIYSVYLLIERVIPELKLANRKWGNLGKASHRKELKALKTVRRRHISSMASTSGSDKEMYYDLVVKTEQKIADLRGKGYTHPKNEPVEKHSSRW